MSSPYNRLKKEAQREFAARERAARETEEAKLRGYSDQQQAQDEATQRLLRALQPYWSDIRRDGYSLRVLTESAQADSPFSLCKEWHRTDPYQVMQPARDTRQQPKMNVLYVGYWQWDSGFDEYDWPDGLLFLPFVILIWLMGKLLYWRKNWRDIVTCHISPSSKNPGNIEFWILGGLRTIDSQEAALDVARGAARAASQVRGGSQR
jgi:hypothetical protein